MLLIVLFRAGDELLEPGSVSYHAPLRRSQVGVREAQSLGRIPETLTVAMEFITMPTLQEQLPAMEELRKQTLRYAFPADINFPISSCRTCL